MSLRACEKEPSEHVSRPPIRDRWKIPRPRAPAGPPVRSPARAGDHQAAAANPAAMSRKSGSRRQTLASRPTPASGVNHRETYPFTIRHRDMTEEPGRQRQKDDPARILPDRERVTSRPKASKSVPIAEAESCAVVVCARVRAAHREAGICEPDAPIRGVTRRRAIDPAAPPRPPTRNIRSTRSRSPSRCDSAAINSRRIRPRNDLSARGCIRVRNGAKVPTRSMPKHRYARSERGIPLEVEAPAPCDVG